MLLVMLGTHDPNEEQSANRLAQGSRLATWGRGPISRGQAAGAAGAGEARSRSAPRESEEMTAHRGRGATFPLLTSREGQSPHSSRLLEGLETAPRSEEEREESAEQDQKTCLPLPGDGVPGHDSPTEAGLTNRQRLRRRTDSPPDQPLRHPLSGAEAPV